MIVIVIILLVMFIIFYKNGGADKIKYPFYMVAELEECRNKMPDKFPPYCIGTSFHNNDELPDYSYQIKKIFGYLGNQIFLLNRYKNLSFICNEYGNLYTSLDYLSRTFKIFKNDVIYIDGYHGLVPSIIADVFKVNVHFFSLKKQFKSHPRVKHYKRLPNDSDFKKLRNMILISFVLFMADNIAFAGANIKNAQRQFQNKLYSNFIPRGALLLYQGMDSHEIIVDGFIKIIPFYFISRSGFFTVEVPVRDILNRKQLKINLYDISNRLLVFNLCQRNIVKNGFNWDTTYAHNVLKKVGCHKIVYDRFGDLPKVKKTSEIPCKLIIPQLENGKLVDPQERQNIEHSVFVDRYENHIDGIEIKDYNKIELKIIKDRYIEIFEPRLKILTYVFEKLYEEKMSLAFYNNVEYFCEFMMKGHHYFTELPKKIKYYIDLVEYQKFYVGTEMELKQKILERKSTLIPENFICDAILDGFKKIADVFPKEFGKIDYIWIDPVPVIITGLHACFPKLQFKVLGSIQCDGVKFTIHDPADVKYFAKPDDFYLHCI